MCVCMCVCVYVRRVSMVLKRLNRTDVSASGLLVGMESPAGGEYTALCVSCADDSSLPPHTHAYTRSCCVSTTLGQAVGDTPSCPICRALVTTAPLPCLTLDEQVGIFMQVQVACYACMHCRTFHVIRLLVRRTKAHVRPGSKGDEGSGTVARCASDVQSRGLVSHKCIENIIIVVV